jgi:hypothetical protein
MVFNLSSDVLQVQYLIQLYPPIYCPLFFNLFMCTVLHNATAARKVGEGMAVQREWDLRKSSYIRFISLIRVCAKCGNDHALFVLGLVKSQPLSLIFPNYLALLSMYLMSIFCRRISTDGRGRATGLKHLRQAMDRGHTTTDYMFAFLMIKDNTGALPDAVEQPLEALDKFSIPSIADPMIRNWIRSMHEDVVLMVRMYEI